MNSAHLVSVGVRAVAKKLGRAVRRIGTDDGRVVSLRPEGAALGSVLLSFIIDPFLLRPGQSPSAAHQHDWESLQMARTFVDLGYAVDVISYKNSSFVPRKKYSVAIDARRNLERLTRMLDRDCIRIMHIDTAHILFHNAAEAKRLLDLQQRRGVTLAPRRFELPNWGIEHADCATIYGNDFTIATYSYARKPMYRVPTTSVVRFPSPEQKDFESCRHRFLWFASGGMVHKGLDVVLEAFAAMPDLHLTVCGPVHRERDFETAFSQELYHTPNIRTVGWTDVRSADFAEILRTCVGLVYPSCSEGQSGAVVTCLHAGLIPIVSYESGVDVGSEFGMVLPDCTIPRVQQAVRAIAGLPADTLRQMATRSWDYARVNHTRERFADEYRKAVVDILTRRTLPVGAL